MKIFILFALLLSECFLHTDTQFLKNVIDSATSVLDRCPLNVNRLVSSTLRIAATNQCAVCDLLGDLVEQPNCLLFDSKVNGPIEDLVQFQCVKS